MLKSLLLILALLVPQASLAQVNQYHYDPEEEPDSDPECSEDPWHPACGWWRQEHCIVYEDGDITEAICDPDNFVGTASWGQWDNGATPTGAWYSGENTLCGETYCNCYYGVLTGCIGIVPEHCRLGFAFACYESWVTASGGTGSTLPMTSEFSDFFHDNVPGCEGCHNGQAHTEDPSWTDYQVAMRDLLIVLLTDAD